MPSAFDDIEGFEWMEWVVDKIIDKHGVEPAEVEQCFQNRPQKVRYSGEGKYVLRGQAQSGRYLFVVYTWRGRWIRVISARDMTPRERSVFRRK